MEKIIELIAEQNALNDVFTEITKLMIDCDDEFYNGLEMAHDLVEKKLKSVNKKMQDLSNPKKEEEKINFWDIKASIHEHNKNNANCIF